MKIQQTLVLIKEETRNIFDFDLQEKIKLKFWINGYSKMQLVLDCEKEMKNEEQASIVTFDGAGIKLIIHANISQEVAGFKVSFHVQNCLIDDSG
jgi:hypothetical protein